jgi:GntR family transcriptional regulator
MYKVIYQDVASQIADGELHPHDRLPSEPALAEQYGVSRMTVRQALDQLTAERLVVRRPGAGTFVATPPTVYRLLNRLSSFGEDVNPDHGTLTTQICAQEVSQPLDDVSQRLGLKPRQKAIHLLRLRLVDGQPVAIHDSWLPYAVAPALAREELVDGSLYRTLRERYGVQPRWAEQEISASAASPDEAKSLDVAVGCPLIRMTRTTYSDGPNPIEFATSLTRPEFPVRIRLDA